MVPLHLVDIDARLIIIEVVDIHAQDHRRPDVGADSPTPEVAAQATLVAALDHIVEVEAVAVAMIHEVAAEAMILEVEAEAEAILEVFREVDAENLTFCHILFFTK